MAAEGWQERMASTLPLRINDARYDGDFLHLGGPRWNLNVGCSWRWLNVSGRMVSGLSMDAGAEVPPLVTDELVAVTWVGPDVVGTDPHFELASGGRIEIFSDLPFDSWTLHIPGLTLVGPVQ